MSYGSAHWKTSKVAHICKFLLVKSNCRHYNPHREDEDGSAYAPLPYDICIIRTIKIFPKLFGRRIFLSFYMIIFFVTLHDSSLLYVITYSYLLRVPQIGSKHYHYRSKEYIFMLKS